MNILATWICLDSKENESYFPSSKGLSSDLKIQEIYWKCLISCLYTARYFNPNIRLLVFSNASNIPVIDSVDFKETFQKLKIEFHKVEFKYKTPLKYYGNWRNQFFEFSIFDYISNSDSFDLNDNFCLIDADCIITQSLDQLFNEIESKKFLHYLIQYEENYIINGLSRIQMKQVFENLSNIEITKTPNYYAGEFFASKIDGVKSVNNSFKVIWPKLLKFNLMGALVLNEEAHVLSYIYFENQCENSYGNNFIKRLWTDPTTMRNIELKDEFLPIWHLPAEKRTGFKSFFKLLRNHDFSLEKYSHNQLNNLTKRLFSIPNLSLTQKIYYEIKKTAKLLLRK